MANTDKFADFYRKVCTYFTEFSNNTSIHGFKYLTENGRLVIEKLWWCGIFAVCVFVCGHCIANCSKKWDANPVFIGYGQTPKTFLDIPFPAITVCPEHKIVQSRYNFTDYLIRNLNGEHLTSQEQKDFDDSLLVCQSIPVEYYNVSNTADSKSTDFLIRNCPTLEEIFKSCYIDGYYLSCAKIFSPLFLNDGLCFTFNMLNRTELFSEDFYMPEGFMQNNKSTKWSFDEGYDRTKQEVYPFRPKRWHDGVYLELKTIEADVDPLCNKFKGFKLFVHHPAEIPSVPAVPLEIAHKSYRVYINPSVVTTAPGLKSIDPHRRKCYFSNERRLKFFRIYTHKNCENECFANYTLERCGCSVLNMPREKSTRICNERDKQCFIATEGEFLRHHMEIDVSTGAQAFCGCLPTCNLVSYEAEVTRNKFLDPSDNFADVSQAIVEIMFKKTIFASQERNELYSTTDFWADCGGLLSLFTGFSVLSLVEIAYYLSLRWLCNIWKFGRKSWFGSTRTV